jgi:hypothetical protein
MDVDTKRMRVAVGRKGSVEVWDVAKEQRPPGYALRTVPISLLFSKNERFVAVKEALVGA